MHPEDYHKIGFRRTCHTNDPDGDQWDYFADIRENKTESRGWIYLSPVSERPRSIYTVLLGCLQCNGDGIFLTLGASEMLFGVWDKELLQQASQSTVEAKKELQSAKRKIRELGTQPEAESQK